MDDWEVRNLSWILFLFICLNAMMGYSLVCLSEQVDKNERRLEQMHEQLEEIKDSA